MLYFSAVIVYNNTKRRSRKGDAAINRVFRYASSRVVFIALFILIQAAALIVTLLYFTEQFSYFYAGSTLLALILVVCIVNEERQPTYQIAWIILVLVLPIFGVQMYLMFGSLRLSRREQARRDLQNLNYAAALSPLHSAADKLAQESPAAAVQSNYIAYAAKTPPLQNTQAEFLPGGEIMLEKMLDEISRAQHYVFIQYFIIKAGVMWDRLLAALAEKAAQGLDVRVIYDDLGSAFTLPVDFHKTMEEKGIRCGVFNRFTPILSARHNNRNHCKMCIIDGIIAFTGGVNIADHYININCKFGHWLDSGVLLRGDAAWAFTALYLGTWNAIHDSQADIASFAPQRPIVGDDGYAQPFLDTPLDRERCGKTVYLNMINRAQRYVYICTPYLLIDNEIITALTTAAKGGVDVRILTPNMSDGTVVQAITRSYYGILTKGGVRIYEYSPGQAHSKVCVADDDYGLIGTINLDYRSLYLHYECAVWLYRNSAVAALRDDYLANLEKSKEISYAECCARPWHQRFYMAVLRLFAPLM